MTEEPKYNLLIGTPCYSGLLHQDYAKSMIEYSGMGVPITYIHIGNESLITRARNTIISFFHANEQFTHLLFLDADIYLSAQNLAKLLTANTDVIGAPVPLKGFDPNGNPVYNIGQILKQNDLNSFIEVEHVGTAVLLLTREACDELCKYAHTYTGSSLTRGEKVDGTHYDVFRVGVVDGNYLSEDYYVCKHLIALGYKIIVDSSIRTRHSGSFTWQG